MGTRSSTPGAGITQLPAADTTATLPTPVSTPQTPGVSRPSALAPGQTGPAAPGVFALPARFLAKLVRLFALPTNYSADVAQRVIPVAIVADATKPQADDPTHQGADYKVFSVSLAAALNRAPIDGTKDLAMSFVTVVSLTAGATAQLHLGDQDPIDIGGTGLGVGTTFELNPPVQSFLAVTCAAQAGATLKLMVSAGMRLG